MSDKTFSLLSGYITLKQLAVLFIVCCISFIYRNGKAQESYPKILTLNNVINAALSNHPVVKNAELSVQSANLQKRSIVDLGPANVNYLYGQLHSSLKDPFFEIEQNLGSPFSYISKAKVIKQKIQLSKTEQQLSINELIARAKILWFQWIFTWNKLSLIQSESLYYNEFPDSVPNSNTEDDSTLLERLKAETRYAEIQNRLFQTSEDLKIITNQIKQVMVRNDDILPSDTILELYAIQAVKDGPDKFSPSNQIALYEGIFLMKKAESHHARSMYSPEISAGYFNQKINNVKGFEGLKLGLSFPLWFLPQSTRVKESVIQQNMASNDLEYQKFFLEKSIENLKIQLDKKFVEISFYRENALKQADLLEKVATTKYNNRKISYIEFLENVNNSYTIRQSYIEKILGYNTVAVELEYLIN